MMKIFYSLTVCAVMLLAGCAHQATKNPEPASPSPDNDLMIGNRGSVQGQANTTMNANTNNPPTPEELSQRQMSLNIYEQKLNAYKTQLDNTRDQLTAQAQQLKAREQELSHREASVKQQNTRKKVIAKNATPANANQADAGDAANTNANTKTDNSNQALTEILHKLQNGTYSTTTDNASNQ
jgi:chromosome segregation ATPase